MNETKRPEYRFDQSFMKVFESKTKSFEHSMDKLRNIKKLVNEEKAEYHICNCAYKMRYITPSNVSTYVSDLVKAFKSGLFGHNNVCDIEMFSVAIVKRFIEENGCISFESTSTLGQSAYLNPQTTTLKDLIVVTENDIYDKQIYSAYEIDERVVKMESDIKRMESMYFSANIKKIVNNLPSILEKEAGMYQQDICDLLMAYIESFIMFALTLNELTAAFMLAYAVPRSSFRTSKAINDNDDQSKNVDDEDTLSIFNTEKPINEWVDEECHAGIHEYITECCLLKTNNMAIRSKIPFDFNMRNIVLQDVHPKFKDTLDALCFIINDSRSPIHQLLLKYSTDKGEEYFDGDIARMFFGQDVDNYASINGCCEHRNSLEAEYEHVGFHTNVSWLDGIAHGNNFLDGNYRNDSNGNHHRHPISNTLSMIYRMYGGIELKSNTDLANNICRVSNTMKRIIRMYPNGGIQNWDLVKDVLCLLGEILTRNILKLYDNNTQVIHYSDQMEDTMKNL